MPCIFDCNRAPGSVCARVCFPNQKCPHVCVPFPKIPFVNPPPPPPPPPPTYAHNPPRRILLLLSLITTATLIGAIFMVCLLVKKLSQHRRSRRNRLALFGGRRETLPDDEDEEGPVLEHHHIWYIQTVGLQQSVIDSITMFKYRKGENLIDGADCSICLGEFQEDESLRLLPKCSHAFHLPCIDTWLRSHKNCPLCRAPVVSDPAAPSLTPIEPVSAHPPPAMAEDTQMEMEEENRGDEGSGEGTSNSIRESEIPIKGQGLARTLSDLTENQSHETVENEGQGLRRSVSMDSVSALAIYQATANIQVRDEGSSSSGGSVSRNVQFPKRGVGNQSLYNLVKTISFGRSVQKGAIAMKRLSSSSRKLQWPARHLRSQSSVLPL